MSGIEYRKAISCGLAVMAAMLLSAGAISDAELEKRWLHRVQPGETIRGLARRAGMDEEVFKRINSNATITFRNRTVLRAGAIVRMKQWDESEKFIPSSQFGGRYCLHEYEFHGIGNPHLPRLGEDPDPEQQGSEVDCRWSVAWPAAKCGLVQNGIDNLRAKIISGSFGFNFNQYENDVWKEPKKIEEAERYFKRHAWEKFACIGSDKESWHICSHWNFDSDGKLTWPFGMGEDSEEWYERPVISYISRGYANDGGNGCHSVVFAGVFRIPDGKMLNEYDYFRKDTMNELMDLVLERMFHDNDATIEDTLDKDESMALAPGVLDISVSSYGMTWWVPPYLIFPGSFGVVHVTVPWDDLLMYLREP